MADLRERIQIDEWDTAAWEALVAAVSDAAERDPSPQQLEQQRVVFNDFLAKFPTAVSPLLRHLLKPLPTACKCTTQHVTCHCTL